MEETKDTTQEIYEVGYHIVPTVSQEAVAKEADEIKAMFSKHGAEIISEGTPNLIDLAYEITHDVEVGRSRYEKAYFGWIKFRADKSEAPAIHEGMKSNRKVLRFILIKTVEEDTLLPVDEDIASDERDESADAEDESGEGDEDTKKKERSDIDKSIDDLLVE